ncbi:MAG: hypothetical protein JSR80_01145 [Verrucomicrobia bacterium]|nr:hypothetical protein [Verrucomicrobiota bacterium]
MKTEKFIEKTEVGEKKIVLNATCEGNPSIEAVKIYFTQQVGPSQEKLSLTQGEAKTLKSAITSYTRLGRVKKGFLAFAGIAAIATGIAFAKGRLRPTQIKLAAALTPISLVGAGVANFGENARAKKAASALQENDDE